MPPLPSMASTQSLLEVLSRRFPDDADELQEACTELLRQRLGTVQRLAKLNDSQWQRLNLPMGIEAIIREEVDAFDSGQHGALNSGIAGPTGSASISDIRSSAPAASQNNPVYIVTDPSGNHRVSDTDAMRAQSDLNRPEGNNDLEPDGDPADDKGALSSNLTEFTMAHTASLRRWGTGPLETAPPTSTGSNTGGNSTSADGLVPPPTPPPPPPGVATDAGTYDSACGSEPLSPARSPLPKAVSPNRRTPNNDLLKRIEENESEENPLDIMRHSDPGVHVKNTFLEVMEPDSPKPAGAQSYPVTSMRRRPNMAGSNDGTGSAESDPVSYAPSSRRSNRASRNNAGNNSGHCGGVISNSLGTNSGSPASFAAAMEEAHPWDGSGLPGPPPHLVATPWAPWPPHLGPGFPQAPYPPQMMAYPNMIPLAPHPAAVAAAASGKIQPRSMRKPQQSQGSSLHASGQCKPCAWFWKPQGCENAELCLHCHLCPEGELKARKKDKINAMRQGMHEPAPRW